MVTRKTAGQAQKPAPQASPPAPPFISEGVRNDVQTYGQAVDPATGRLITASDI